MKYILHIDTSSAVATVALSGNGTLLSKAVNTDARNHAASVNIMVDNVLTENNLSLSGLSAVSVVGGPGSYTGLRIGLSTAKGYCYALDLPLIMLSKLELLGKQLIRAHKDEFDHYFTVLKARDGEFFIAMYNNDENEMIAPEHIFQDKLGAFFDNSGKTAVTGIKPEEIIFNKDVIWFENEEIETENWCSLSLDAYNCNRIVNLAHAEPLYLKQVYTHNKL